MGSSTTQGLSYKSHCVLLASYFASRSVTRTHGRWHRQAREAGLPSSGWGSTVTQGSGSPRSLPKHTLRPIPTFEDRKRALKWGRDITQSHRTQ